MVQLDGNQLLIINKIKICWSNFSSNKIILISDNGKIKIFDAKSGKNENFSIKGPVLIPPQIAEGTLVVINNNGLIQL